MFFNAVAKYVLAVHLALLAALPGAVAPFVPGESLAVLILWLSAFALVWLLTEPSILGGEHLSSARRRVRKNIMVDPVFWFFIVAVAFALIRLFNNGIQLAYDSEQAVWFVAKPVLEVMPGSCGSAGFLPLTVVVACSITVCGVRHALGLAARLTFGLAASCIAGLGGLAAVLNAVAGNEFFVKALSVRFDSVEQFGVLFGVWLIIAVASGIHAETRKWRFARLLFFLGVGGNASGLVYFTPPLIAALFLAVALIYAAFSLAFLKRAGSPGSVARSLAFLLLGFSVAAFFVVVWLTESQQQFKLNYMNPSVAFSEMYLQMSGTLSRIAREMWMIQPWCGVGAGAFPLHVPFIAEKADWAVIPTEPTCAVNSLWTILAERGIIGSAVLIVGLGLFICFYAARMIESCKYNSKRDEADPFAFACAPVVWCPVFLVGLVIVCGIFTTCLINDLMVFALAVSIALATASFPREPVDKRGSSKQ